MIKRLEELLEKIERKERGAEKEFFRELAALQTESYNEYVSYIIAYNEVKNRQR